MGRSGYNSKSDGDEEIEAEWRYAQQAPVRDPLQTVPPPVSLEEWRSKPWKYKGYPAFSKWMASSNDFFLVRRFGHLNARVLLLLQSRIEELEENLAALDTRAQQNTDDLGNSGSLRNDPQKERTKLMEQLSKTLKNYNEYLTSYASIRSWRPADKYQIANVENWFSSNLGAIDVAEQQFIKTGKDVVALVPRDRSPLHRFLERYEPFLKSRLFRETQWPDQSIHRASFYYNHSRVEATVGAAIVIVGIILLLGPMWALQFIGGSSAKLGVITGFVVFFTALLSSTTLAKPYEVLAGTAAYSAVLIVYLQTGNSGQT